MIAKFVCKQPSVKIITTTDKDYIYICLNEREGEEVIDDSNYENLEEMADKTFSRTEHYYEYDYDEFSVPIGSIDYEDLNANPHKYLYMELRKNKLSEISKACEKVIYNGVDIELSDGIAHFSLTEKDQLNLFGIRNMITDGRTNIEYHSDGKPCKFYDIDDMTKIIDESMAFVTYHRTYCNSLNMWIKNTSSEDEIKNIYYGIDIPDKYQSEVLKSYIISAKV